MAKFDYASYLSTVSAAQKKSSSVKDEFFKTTDSCKTIIENYLSNPDKYVYPFVIHERNKDRTIITYNDSKLFGQELRKTHESILAWFSDIFADRNPLSYAYQKGIRCSDALKPHLKSNCFIKLDIHHFFESITEERFFARYGKYFNKKSTEIIKGCFYKGSLSIGFVTSPMLSDFFMKDFDSDVEHYLGGMPGLHYSRYSDDILISAEEENFGRLDNFYEFIEDQLKAFGFEVNPNKLQRRQLSYYEHNSISYLGLALSKADSIENKITISKRYILFLLKLIEKNEKYGSKCKGLLDEINSRVAYLAYNSPVSYKRFQKKHLNKFGKEYNFIPKKPLDRTQPVLANEIPDFSMYMQIFDIDLHTSIKGTNKYGFFKNDAITLKQYKKSNEKVVHIPGFIDSIGPRAFQSHREIEEIVFDGNIKHIDKDAFKNCFKLQRIILPESLRYIEEGAFNGCSKLEEINLPKRIKIIEASTFNGAGLKSINLPNDLKEIRDRAFAGCNKLEKIIIPDSVSVISQNAFSGCKELKKVKLPNGLLTIQSETFAECHRLSDIALPESLLEIQAKAFSNCLSLKEITLPDNLVSIGDNAFDNCLMLEKINVNKNRVFKLNSSGDVVETSSGRIVILRNQFIDKDTKVVPAYAFANKDIARIEIPEGVEVIEPYAFKGCARLKEVILPDSLKSIGEHAFDGCISLSAITIPNGVKVLSKYVFANCLNLRLIYLPEDLEVIDDGAFAKDRLFNISLPKGLKEIGYKAFKDCVSIPRIHIGKDVKKINPKAFYGCSKTVEEIIVDPDNRIYSDGLSNVIYERKSSELLFGCANSLIPDGVTVIEPYAFYGCDKLLNVKLPKSVTKIGKCAFYGCENLSSVDFGNVYAIEEKAFYGTKKLEKAILPESLTALGKSAFANSGIKALRLPNSLAAIDSSTFAEDVNLEEIHISASISNIGRQCFSNSGNISKITVDPANSKYSDLGGKNGVFTRLADNSLSLVMGCKNTVIPNDLDSIGSYAFYNVKGLKSLKFVKPIKLSNCAFHLCSDLEEIDADVIGGSIPMHAFDGCVSLKKFIIGKYIVNIEACAFARCLNLESISISDSVKTIGLHAFYGCEKLAKVELPNSVTLISNGAFGECASLKEINLPNSITSIGTNAFIGCKSLETISLPKVLTTINQKTFASCSSLKEVNLPNNLQTIDFGAFLECKKLSKIHLPNSLESIKTEAFRESGLVEIALGDKINSIAIKAFRECEKLTKVDLSKAINLKTISNETFAGCSSLKEVKLPASLVSINDYAFAECPNLSSINIPDSVQSIGGGAFAYDSKIKKIYIPKDLVSFHNGAYHGCDIDSIEASKDNQIFSTNGNMLFVNKYNADIGKAVALVVKEGNIPDDVELIMEGSFNHIVDKLTSLKLPKSLKVVESKVFAQINNIKHIDFANTELKVIGDSAFFGCSLDNVKLPSSVRRIGDFAFFNSNVKDIFISKDVESIGMHSFDPKQAISIVVEEGNKFYSSLNSNVLVQNEDMSLIMACKNSSVPDGIKIIKNFGYVIETINKVSVPESVDSIYSGLAKDVNIEHFNVSKNNPCYMTYGNDALLMSKKDNRLFYYRKDGIVPDGIKIVGSGLILSKPTKKLYIPSSVDRIEVAGIASNKVDVEEISVDENNPYFDSRDNSNAIIQSNTNKLVLGCKNTVIPDSVTRIGSFAFFNAVGFDEIKIGKNVRFIENNAFNNMKEYKSISVHPENKYFKVSDDGKKILYIKDKKPGEEACVFELLPKQEFKADLSSRLRLYVDGACYNATLMKETTLEAACLASDELPF